MNTKLTLSPLPHTWILDVDGTLCIHNGFKHGEDTLLPGVREFFASIPPQDMIILLTSRKAEQRAQLVDLMHKNGLRFDHIICDAPMGERILINDSKPSGLSMAHAICKKRDAALDLNLHIDNSL